jgi:hypothetical protein
MRLKLLKGFLKALYEAPAMYRHMKKVNQLSEIANSNPTTEEGFKKQREAIRELNRLREF